MRSFQELLEDAIKLHGSLCAGQVLGVRMAMLACRLLGIEEPKSEEFKKNIIAFIEVDRCCADAVQAVTGCQLGKRSLKHIDYGKAALTLLNLKDNKAVRVSVKESARHLAAAYAPDIKSKNDQQVLAYQVMPDELLFNIEAVEVKPKPEDMPGKPKYKVICERCGEAIMDKREVIKDNKVLCKACALGAYYKVIERINL